MAVLLRSMYINSVEKPLLLFVILLFSTHVLANENRVRVEITGVEPALEANISAHLSFSDEICPLSDRRFALLRRRMDEEIIQAGQALGYYHMKINKRLIPSNNCWVVRVDIKPDLPIIVQQVQITLSPEPSGKSPFKRLLANLPVKPGDQLNHAQYELIKSRLLSIAAESGYFDAVFERTELLIHQESRSANIFIHYNIGSRYRFGALNIDQTILDTRFVRRYFSFKEGDFYSSDALAASQRALNNSAYFANVTFESKIDMRDNEQIPIMVTLHARKQFAYSLGIGAATDTGPRLKFAFENRYASLLGHQFSSQLNLGPIRSEITTDYLIPYGNPEKEQIRLSSAYVHEDTRTALSDTYNIGVGYSLLYQNNWLQTYSLSFQREDFILANEKNRSDLLIPGISWLKSKADHPVYPLRGWRLFAQLRGSFESFGSDVSFTQFYYRAKYIRKLGPGRFLSRLEAGSSNVSDFHQLPASVRFFAGGDNSVRGYDYHQLGPRDDNNNVIGGSHLFVWGLEYDYRFLNDWAVAAFYDQGNAFNGRDTDFMRGAGLGLRWLSPIGPIRFDIASAIDNDYAIRFHLSMGPDL